MSASWLVFCSLSMQSLECRLANCGALKISFEDCHLLLLTYLKRCAKFYPLQLFGKVATNQGDLDPERAESDIWGQIRRRNHFRSFFPAIQVLFRSETKMCESLLGTYKRHTKIWFRRKAQPNQYLANLACGCRKGTHSAKWRWRRSIYLPLL